jgi:hypothetical protein
MLRHRHLQTDACTLQQQQQQHLPTTPSLGTIFTVLACLPRPSVQAAPPPPCRLANETNPLRDQLCTQPYPCFFSSANPLSWQIFTFKGWRPEMSNGQQTLPAQDWQTWKAGRFRGCVASLSIQPSIHPSVHPSPPWTIISYLTWLLGDPAPTRSLSRPPFSTSRPSPVRLFSPRYRH